jgi:hypothetical protein
MYIHTVFPDRDLACDTFFEVTFQSCCQRTTYLLHGSTKVQQQPTSTMPSVGDAHNHDGPVMDPLTIRIDTDM